MPTNCCITVMSPGGNSYITYRKQLYHTRRQIPRAPSGAKFKALVSTGVEVNKSSDEQILFSNYI
jgi:hypothetical protein